MSYIKDRVLRDLKLTWCLEPSLRKQILIQGQVRGLAVEASSPRSLASEKIHFWLRDQRHKEFLKAHLHSHAIPEGTPGESSRLCKWAPPCLHPLNVDEPVVPAAVTDVCEDTPRAEKRDDTLRWIGGVCGAAQLRPCILCRKYCGHIQKKKKQTAASQGNSCGKTQQRGVLALEQGWEQGLGWGFSAGLDL